jgi:tripartite-type tricarboxylate transporter receptor subunit TctC
MKCLFCILAATLLAAGSPSLVLGQGYPSKPVRVIVPHPGGGGPVDAPARGLAEFLAKTLGQPFLVENRDGAQGIIGTEAVVKSSADGYTLLFTSASVITLNALVLKSVPYDSERDLAPVAYVGVTDNLLMVHPSVPARNLEELISLAKAKPNSVTWGTLGTVGNGTLLASWFKKHRDAQFYMIPYKSTLQAFLATVAGEVNVVSYAAGQGAQLVKAGRLRALAAIGSKRVAALPDVPAAAESGVDLKFRGWMGLFAPKGTSAEIVARLNAASAKALADPAYQQKYLIAVGVSEDEISGVSPEKFAAFIREDREAYEEVVSAAGIKKQ